MFGSNFEGIMIVKPETPEKNIEILQAIHPKAKIVREVENNE